MSEADKRHLGERGREVGQDHRFACLSTLPLLQDCESQHSLFIERQEAGVLEAGCGTGDCTLRVINPDLELVAFDFSRAMIDMARKNLGQQK
ncbi:MAG TPA: methyltransferase domain-containing protein [Candidatus Angelobacter sp.]|nr:methyltransferase domain-containing protein [Candidatus Angelobacter sp.]